MFRSPTATTTALSPIVLLALVAYTLSLALEPIESVSAGAQVSNVSQGKSPAQAESKTKVAKLNVATQIKRPSVASVGRKAAATRATGERGNNKFQVRMMQADRMDQQHSVAGQSGSYYSSDYLAAHSLLPTFTDQEQGDEMVALASDQDSTESHRPEPNGATAMGRNNEAANFRGAEHRHQQKSGSRLVVDKPMRGQHGETGKEQRVAGGSSAGKQRQQQPVDTGAPGDEYYGEDDDDDDMEPQQPKLSSPEFDQVGSPVRKEIAEPSFRPIKQLGSNSGSGSSDSGSYGDHPRASSDEGGKRNKAAPVVAANRPVSLKSPPGSLSDGGWMPSSGSGVSLSQASGQQESGEQFKQARQHHGAGEKITGLLGAGNGGSAFSRADVAIEYLKNILKTKQGIAAANNSSSPGHHDGGSKYAQSSQQASDKSGAGNNRSARLSAFASKLNQIFLANTSSSDSSVAPQNVNDSKVEFMLAGSGKKKESDNSPDYSSSSGSPFTQAQAAEAKFSISDAKPTPSFESNPLHSMRTTKLPFGSDEESSARQFTHPPDSIYMPIPSHYSRPQQHQQQQYQFHTDMLSPINIPNGTPLGGDYIESLDEYPRASVRQQQQTLAASESRNTPAVFEQVQRDQMLGQVAPQATGDQFLGQVKNDPTKSTQPVSGAQISHESFQLPNGPLASGSPTSSRYFQMQQLTSLPGAKSLTEQSRIEQQATFPATSKSNQFIPSNQPSNGEQQSSLGQQKQQQAALSSQSDEGQSVAANNKTELSAYDKIRALVSSSSSSNKQQEQQQQHASNQSPSSPSQQQPKQQVDSYTDSEGQPAAFGAQLSPPISSKIYKNDPPQFQSAEMQAHPARQAQSSGKSIEIPSFGPASTRPKPPKIVSYNYFESPNEQGESELLATNYQLGDALYSSTGGMEQLLSNSELEAIQSQFMTAEHPIVPISGDQTFRNINSSPQSSFNIPQDSSNLAGLLANLKPSSQQPEVLQKLASPSKQAEDAMKELASSIDEQVSIAAPPNLNNQPFQGSLEREFEALQSSSSQVSEENRSFAPKQVDQDAKRKKSLIVYLNHPRPTDMSKVTNAGESYSLAQSIGDQSLDSFISAKEFDSHGLSKDSKHLDISNLKGLGELKESQDKDGLSVVVIGDAYKYKKIVLLISSKSGGLKFIPMVKDMRKK